MIRVNLIGAGRKKAPKAGSKLSMPTSAVPFVLLLIVAASAAGGYLWYTSLTAKIADLDSKISSATAQKAALEAVIKQNAVFEGRKKALETRIKVIEGLKRNQENPVLALDVLSEAIEKTQYVWLSSLDQSNATLSMNGTGSSLNAIADFYQNLERSGYFRSIEINNATDSAGNFSFSLRAQFAPPVPKPDAPAAPASGGN